MNGVVLRCANCGTIQNSPGECQACHEENVRFYCTQHSPGRWLNTPVCEQCGAEYGKNTPLRRAEQRPAPPAAPPRRTRRGAGAPRSRTPWGAPTPDSTSDVASTDTRRTIERLLREYYSRRPRPPEGMEVARGASAVAGGCLRIVLVAFLFMMLIMFMLSSVGHMLLVY